MCPDSYRDADVRMCGCADVPVCGCAGVPVCRCVSFRSRFSGRSNPVSERNLPGSSLILAIFSVGILKRYFRILKFKQVAACDCDCSTIHFSS
jgi:hypothetical protein